MALRKDGRSQAWAELEDRLMLNVGLLVETGLLSPKEWIGLTIDIEQFRKQEHGTQVLPSDWLSTWLNEPGGGTAIIDDAPAVKAAVPDVPGKLKRKWKPKPHSKKPGTQPEAVKAAAKRVVEARAKARKAAKLAAAVATQVEVT